MDSPSPSPQEIKNREILERTANALGIRIALPRASQRCPISPGQLCWGWSFQGAEVPSAWTEVIRSRTACFESDRPFGVLGFSNGGYLLLHVYAIGLADHTSAPIQFLLNVGSEKWSDEIKPLQPPRRVQTTILIGKSDFSNRDPDQRFAKTTGVRRIEFDGGHELNEAALLAELRRLLRQP